MYILPCHECTPNSTLLVICFVSSITGTCIINYSTNTSFNTEMLEFSGVFSTEIRKFFTDILYFNIYKYLKKIKKLPGLVSCPLEISGLAPIVTTPQSSFRSDAFDEDEEVCLFSDELMASRKSPWKKSESSSLFESLLLS